MDISTPLLTQKQLAERIGVPVRTLERWRSERQGPPYLQLVDGGAIRYAIADVEAWLEVRRINPERSLGYVADQGRFGPTWRVIKNGSGRSVQ